MKKKNPQEVSDVGQQHDQYIFTPHIHTSLVRCHHCWKGKETDPNPKQKQGGLRHPSLCTASGPCSTHPDPAGTCSQWNGPVSCWARHCSTRLLLWVSSEHPLTNLETHHHHSNAKANCSNDVKLGFEDVINGIRAGLKWNRWFIISVLHTQGSFEDSSFKSCFDLAFTVTSLKRIRHGPTQKLVEKSESTLQVPQTC